MSEPVESRPAAAGRPVASLAVLALFAALAVGLTWPAAASDDRAVSVRPDYISNIWNAWWTGHALLDGSSSLYDCDALYFPTGISLARHALSPVNALPSALLARVVGSHAAFKLLLLVHFALSGWMLYLLARELGASARGAILAGLVFSFGPFHAYYIGQLNVATTEFLPLAVLFMVRTWRRGRALDIAGLALAAGLLAASSEYYLVYAALVGCLLLPAGKLLDPQTPYLRGAGRLALGGAVATLVVALVAWPLVSETLAIDQAGGDEAVAVGTRPGMDDERLAQRSNDLLGFAWTGGPEQVIVSWPSMLGWTSLALVLAGWRGLRGRLLWVLIGAAVFAVSLGPTLQVLGEDTGIPLPYAWFSELPLLSMLRKPDRLFVLVQLCFALCCAFAWDDVQRRLPVLAARRAWLGALALVAYELAPAPLQTYELPVSPYLTGLAHDASVQALVDLPFHGGKTAYDARMNLDQTIHGKRIAGGYVTNLARRDEHRRASRSWSTVSQSLADGDGALALSRARAAGLDLVVLHKTEAAPRDPLPVDGSIVWRPFRFARASLLETRQRGHLTEAPLPADELDACMAALRRVMGEPVHEDERVVVYRVPAG